MPPKTVREAGPDNFRNWLLMAVPALYKKDKTFRRYALGVERTLALWDSAQQEWADYISFLGRLLKVNSLPLRRSYMRLSSAVYRPCSLTRPKYPSSPIATPSHCG
jgi:hypothetical protein